MCTYHNYVAPPPWPDRRETDFSSMTPLEGVEIHPLWRREAFRKSEVADLLPIPELDQKEHEVTPAQYERMKPALKLATVLLGAVFTDLAKVRYGMVREEVRGFGIDRVLTDHWRVTDEKLRSFERELMRIARYYRITVHIGDGGDVTGDIERPCTRTECTGNIANYPTYNRVVVQTALSTDLSHFLTVDGWDDIDGAEKYRWYVLVGTTLVHELAHAVWDHRMLPVVEDEFAQHGCITRELPEPRFVSKDSFAEIGFAIEHQLFEGLIAFGHSGIPTTAEAILPPDRVTLTIIDHRGRATAVHQLTADTILAFFKPETWVQSENGELPNFKLDLLPNIRRPGPPAPTILSDPVPILRALKPGKLKPVITEMNELFITKR
ncbi:hypothetical protein ABEF95_002485 [Exophiala dermatitidis]